MTAAEFDLDPCHDPLLSEYERARDSLQTPQWREALQELERLAHRGSIMSMLLVSDAMRTGWMYDQDLPGAERWYRVAYESGSVRGLFGLGLTHMSMERFDEALQELELAAKSGYAPAFNSIAGMYFRGDGMEPDRRLAREFWRKGSSLGHLPSKLNLANQQVRGRYGLLGFLEGAFTIFPAAIEIAKVRIENPYTDRLR